MPGLSLQKEVSYLSDDYKVCEQERILILEAQRSISGGKTFSALRFKQQIQYARWNKKLAENYWQSFLVASTDENYHTAARDVVCALNMAFVKAEVLIREKGLDTVSEAVVCTSENLEDQFLTGVRYYLGLGLPQNQTEAVIRFEKLAKQGHLEAQFLMSVAYDYGIGVEKDEAKSESWCLTAAYNGHAFAQFNFSSCNESPTESFDWCKKAADQGLAIALSYLGCGYDKEGVGKDPKRAKRCFLLSAEQGNSVGRYNLAMLYDRRGGEKHSKALPWYLAGAEEGEGMSQLAVGLAYARGQGVEANLIEALRWFRLLTEQGSTKAKEGLKELHLLSADYVLALANRNIKKVCRIIMGCDELKKEFLQYDFSALVRDPSSLDDLTLNLKAAAASSEDNNASLISFLTIMDGEIAACDKYRLNFRLRLVEAINFAVLSSEQIQQLLHCLCNLAYQVDSELVVQSLIVLSLKVKSLSIFLDKGLCQLVATHLVRNLFNKKYTLLFDKDFNHDDLWVIVFACSTKPGITVETVNLLLQKKLLIDSNERPSILLPKLKSCITRGQFKSTVLDNIAQGIPDETVDDTTWAKLLQTLQEGADAILTAAKGPNFFKIELSPLENSLLSLLKEANTTELMDWINTHQALEPHQKDKLKEHPTEDLPAKRVKITESNDACIILKPAV